ARFGVLRVRCRQAHAALLLREGLRRAGRGLPADSGLPAGERARLAESDHHRAHRGRRDFSVRSVLSVVIHFFRAACMSARISSACFGASTFFQTFLMRPSPPIQYVIRATPQVRRPYMFFSFHAPYILATSAV